MTGRGEATDLSGYRIEIGNDDYTLPPGVKAYNSLVLWQDDLGFAIPDTGTVTLYDASGTLISEFPYSKPNVDESWAGDSVAPTPGK